MSVIAMADRKVSAGGSSRVQVASVRRGRRRAKVRRRQSKRFQRLPHRNRQLLTLAAAEDAELDGVFGSVREAEVGQELTFAFGFGVAVHGDDDVVELHAG